MATERRIGACYVEVLAKGISKVQSDLNAVKIKLMETGQGSNKLGLETEKAGTAAQKQP